MITPATHQDIPALAEMLRDLNEWHVPHAPHRLRQAGDIGDLGQFFETRMAKGAQILITRTEGTVRGYLMWTIQDRPADAVSKPVRRALLDHIYVEPIWRRRGLAQRMIQRFEADSAAGGCSGWITHVFAVNTASQRLMAGQGAQHQTVVMEKRYLR